MIKLLDKIQLKLKNEICKEFVEFCVLLWI